MAKIYAIANQKGGVGKTTTATALSGGLQLKGYRTLLIDADPQCNSSDTYQAEINDAATLYDLFCNSEPINEVIQHTPSGDIIACDPLLNDADSLLTKTGKEHILRKAAMPILKNYDYIIIDTPPHLGVLLVNALTFADAIIVPTTADRYSLQGLSQLQESILAAQEYTNPKLAVAGLLFTKFNSRTNLSREVLEVMSEIVTQLNTILFDTQIRESTAARESQSNRSALYNYAPKCTTAIDYLALVDELLKRGL